MLDPDLYADYEAWRAAKLAGSIDLSIATYNVEMAAQAIAWEAGVKAAYSVALASDREVEEILADNPYRKPGMRGELPVSETPRRVTSDPVRLIDARRLTDAEPRYIEMPEPPVEPDPWT